MPKSVRDDSTCLYFFTSFLCIILFFLALVFNREGIQTNSWEANNKLKDTTGYELIPQKKIQVLETDLLVVQITLGLFKPYRGAVTGRWIKLHMNSFITFTAVYSVHLRLV